MFGFIIGAACLAGLVHVLRGRRCYHRGGWGHHHHGHEGGRWGGGWRDRGEGFWLRGLYSRLDATPGQEKVIRSIVDEMRSSADDVRAEMRRSRHDLACTLRSDNVDETVLGEAFARREGALEKLRKNMVGAIAKLHDALDERQRKLLAEWLDSPRSFWGGPYRGGAM